MTKISVYQIDENVTADDKWIGTDVNTYNKTKNFTPRKLATYFNGNQVINTGVDLLYKYFTITPPEERPAGTLSFETEIGPTVEFSDINTFLLSKTTLKGNDISEFLHFLVNSTSLIYKAKNINLFGSYKIVSIDTYFLDPNFFVVTVDFLEGNGFIEEDEDYMISVVELDKTIPIPQLVKETFEYDSSNSFVVDNEINNVLQVIVNTTSLHPEAYTYTLPSTVTVINELFAGDVITVVYNYLEEFLEVPDLQRVTSVGNHTTNNIVLNNLPGENGDYTTINTLTDLGTFQSYTSPTNIDYQTEYAGYGMFISEIYSPTESKEMLVTEGVIQTSYTDGDNYTSILITSSDPAIEFGKNGVIGKLKSDNIENDITLQFPDKPTGTYTIATTEDVPPFTPSDYDLDEFTNANADPFAKISDLPTYSEFIQDSITNGVIDKAPTENAVYDALQLKQNSLGYTPVNKAGDTMSGDLILNRDPEVALGAATKQYVDNITSGINFHEPVYVATNGPLTANYSNGTGGVGATLTATTNGALYIDGKYPEYLNRVLVFQQSNEIHNGIYDVDVVGDSTHPYRLIRSADADNSPPGEMHYGDYTFTTDGDTNGGRGFICNTTGIIVVGTTPITFVQFNAAQIVTPGYGLENTSPNVIAIDPAVTQEKITLTTTGSSGAATFSGNILNIPQYSGNPGTITSITASSPLTGGTITSSGTIGIPAATSLVSGYLTSTDFTAFTNKENSANKQNSLAVDGTGTKFPTVDAVNAGISSANYWTKSGNNIYNNNTGFVGIATTAPLTQFNVNQTVGASTNKGITITGDEIYQSGNGTSTEGVRLALGVNRTGNRQLWIGDNSAFGSSTKSVFRYQTGGVGFAGIDAVTGNGMTRSLIILGSDTGKTAVGTETDTVINVSNYTAKLNLFTYNESTPSLIIKKWGTASGNFIEAIDSSSSSQFLLENNGDTTFKTLSGTGSRMVIASSTGKISTQAIPVISSNTITGSLTASYIPKALTATTIGNSRLLDINGYLGIDAVYSPTKDITLGNQANREIGVEISNSLTVGRDLMLAAGKAINYAIADFVPYSVPIVGLTNFTINKTTLDIYAIYGGTTMYKKPAGSSEFTSYASIANYTYSMSVNYITNDIWIIANNIIQKQTGGSGVFSTYTTTGLPTPSTIYGNSIFVNPVTNDIWVVLAGASLTGKLYKQTGGTGPFAEYTCNIAFNSGKVIVNPLTNDIFIADSSSYGTGKLIKQTGGSGLFTTVLSTTVKDIDIDYTSGTIYTIHGYGTPANGIYKQLAGTGSFVLQGVVYASGDVFNVNTGFNTLCVEPTTLNVLANFSQSTNRIYQQINYAAGTPDLQGGTLKLNSGTGKGTGASDIEMWTGQVKPSGTDMQTATLRAKINNTGLMTLPSVTNALIEADTTNKAVTTKEYVNNRLVVEKSGNYTLVNADSGGVIIFTASATLTIPNALADGFECTFVTLAGVTLTVDRGSNILYNNTGTVLLPQLSFTLKRRIATDQYITAGSL